MQEVAIKAADFVVQATRLCGFLDGFLHSFETFSELLWPCGSPQSQIIIPENGERQKMRFLLL